MRGLRRRNHNIDIVRIQDAGLTSADDPTVLEWAAQAGRVLLTHDVTTITSHAYERLRSGQRMPGVFQVTQTLSVAQAFEELLLIVECSLEGEWEGQIRHLPLR